MRRYVSFHTKNILFAIYLALTACAAFSKEQQIRNFYGVTMGRSGALVKRFSKHIEKCFSQEQYDGNAFLKIEYVYPLLKIAKIETNPLNSKVDACIQNIDEKHWSRTILKSTLDNDLTKSTYEAEIDPVKNQGKIRYEPLKLEENIW